MAVSIGLILILSALTACGVPEKNYDTAGVDMKYYLSMHEWGPAVDGIRLTLPSGEAISADGLQKDVFSVKVGTGEAEVTEVTAEGANVLYIALKPVALKGAPTGDMENEYPIEVTLSEGKTLTVNGEKYTSFNFAKTGDASSRIAPEVDAANLTRKYYTYYDETVVDGSPVGEIKFNSVAYEPDSLKNDGQKNPLIIWVHGSGEIGDNIDKLLLNSCDIPELWGEKIQSYFKTDGGVSGAYVFAPQNATAWKKVYDANAKGDDANPSIAGSKYSLALMDTINQFIAENGDIDTNRIYIGGPSNGGFMTVNMILTYPDFFAAAYPLCTGYTGNEKCFTPEEVAVLASQSVWLVTSMEDTLYAPKDYSMLIYARVKEYAPQSDVHFSLYDKISGIEDPAASYNGHNSQVYLLTDSVLYDYDAAKIVENFTGITDETGSAITPNSIWANGEIHPSDGSATLGAGVKVTDNSGKAYDSVWEWMNDRSK